MIVNDACSLWYNRIGEFLMSVWERRKETLYGEGPAYKASQNDHQWQQLLWWLNVSDLFFINGQNQINVVSIICTQ